MIITIIPLLNIISPELQTPHHDYMNFSQASPFWIIVVIIGNRDRVLLVMIRQLMFDPTLIHPEEREGVGSCMKSDSPIQLVDYCFSDMMCWVEIEVRNTNDGRKIELMIRIIFALASSQQHNQQTVESLSLSLFPALFPSSEFLFLVNISKQLFQHVEHTNNDLWCV